MAYRYLEDQTTADVAFEVEAESLETLFGEAWEAVLRLMLENPEALAPSSRRTVSFSSDSPEMLLFDFLGELLYRKDAERRFYRIARLELSGDALTLHAELEGETIDERRHGLGVDVKAVTLYAFRVERREELWYARVVLDT